MTRPMTPARANEQAARELDKLARWLGEWRRAHRRAYYRAANDANDAAASAYEGAENECRRRAARLRKPATARARGK